jgi:hypothetical protein
LFDKALPYIKYYKNAWITFEEVIPKLSKWLADFISNEEADLRVMENDNKNKLDLKRKLLEKALEAQWIEVHKDNWLWFKELKPWFFKFRERTSWFGDWIIKLDWTVIKRGLRTIYEWTDDSWYFYVEVDAAHNEAILKDNWEFLIINWWDYYRHLSWRNKFSKIEETFKNWNAKIHFANDMWYFIDTKWNVVWHTKSHWYAYVR